MTPEAARRKYPTLAAMFADGRLKDVTDWDALTRRPEAKARRGDPSTSRRAAAAVAPRVGTQKAVLLDAYAAAEDGLTAHEASEATGLVYVSVSTRVTELVRDGMLRRTGRTRTTGNGRDADVLVIVEAAKAVA